LVKTTRLWVLLGITVLAVSACSTTPSKTEEQTKKAAETNTALGQQYMNRGQYEIALEKLKRAVAYDKTYAPAYTMLGVLYETIGKTDDAAEAYALAVKYDPEGGDVNNNYGAFLCRTGESGKADDYFLTAIDDPFYQTPEIALSNAGACALSSGDLDKAESFF
jgi:type IV pilus assembly protein PilF